MALTPSQRISLLKEISQRLANEDWPLIDVTLKQFGLPWSDEWRGTKDAYVLQMIEGGADDVLLELARHVGFQLQSAPPRIEPPFWRKDMLKLFVTHLATHRKFAAELQEALLGFGISAFVAHNDIEPTKEWQTQIETALATCDALVALLHPDFHDSNWTDQEIGFAMGRGVPVFSVRFGEDPYGFIGRFQAFDGAGKSATNLSRELFEAYRKNKQTQPLMAEILIRLLEESSSFAAAKTHLDYLEDLEVWEQAFSTRLKAALDSNSQVSDAWGVPDRIKALTKKWSSRGV
jgi:nucleoside 2-deoxyribosyltransferase